MTVKELKSILNLFSDGDSIVIDDEENAQLIHIHSEVMLETVVTAEGIVSRLVKLTYTNEGFEELNNGK